MTDTDLFTAENAEVPNAVTTDIPAAPESAPVTTTTAETAPTADVASGDRASSLTSMVLPELRALARQIGVEGASGMRKSELIAAIRERRGDANGAAKADGADAPATQAAPRRERRSSSRRAGAPAA
ncbi:transcription termination factor Rho, partial [Mycobacterium sp. PS03-16]|uniref:Rho termination factor N-terminal domain-containing protein n=1 Tax=Mycobacterium sp. PS03-16 TaxID=2559611 RepID=UPI0011006E3C